MTDAEHSKHLKRIAKEQKFMTLNPTHIDIACVIHGQVYDWIYVERLYNMVTRHSTKPVNFHVWTEPSRIVPPYMIKHELREWPGIGGPKKSWWYKMQMFDPSHVVGRLIYFDLDTVITRNIDWISGLEPQFFWAIKDFKHHWRPSWQGINSSVMVWNVSKFDYVWKNFCEQNIAATVKLYHGDQDYLNTVLNPKSVRFLDPRWIKSWRWQILDGGMDFKSRVYKRPDAGSVLDPDTSVVIFHGHPKPHEVPHDRLVQEHWQ